MRMRRSALAIAMVAGIAAPTVSTVAVAWAKPAAKPAVSHHAKPAPTKKGKPAKATKPVKANFAANGSITAVNAAAHTVTVAVKAGTKDVKGHSVSILLPAAVRIIVNDAPGTAVDLEAGFRITVTGTRLGTVYTASKVQAVSPAPQASPTPSESTPSDAPSTAPTDEPTEQPTDEPTEDPSVQPTA